MARFDNKIFILTPSFPLKTCGEGVFFICNKRIRVNITPIKFNISILKFIFAEVILKAKKQGRKDFYKMKNYEDKIYSLGEAVTGQTQAM